MTVPIERFLVDFHNRSPGGSARAFATLQVTDEAGHRHASSYHALVQALEQANPSQGPLLDLACGDGHLLALLAPTQGSLTGVDISSGELAAARARLGERAQLFQARSQALPLASGSLAAVSCHMALMLMSPPAQVLTELHRVLRHGGHLVAVVPRADPQGTPQQPLVAAWQQALQGCERDERWAQVQFEGRAWCDADRLQALLQPGFAPVHLTRLDAQQRLSPAQAWTWFTEMYDLHLLPHTRRPEVQQRFDTLMQPLLEADGCACLHHPTLLITAKAVHPSHP